MWIHCSGPASCQGCPDLALSSQRHTEMPQGDPLWFQSSPLSFGNTISKVLNKGVLK